MNAFTVRTLRRLFRKAATTILKCTKKAYTQYLDLRFSPHDFIIIMNFFDFVKV